MENLKAQIILRIFYIINRAEAENFNLWLQLHKRFSQILQSCGGKTRNGSRRFCKLCCSRDLKTEGCSQHTTEKIAFIPFEVSNFSIFPKHFRLLVKNKSCTTKENFTFFEITSDETFDCVRNSALVASNQIRQTVQL